MGTAPRRAAALLVAALALAVGQAHGETRLSLQLENAETNEYGDLLLPRLSERKLVVTAYEDDGDRIRPVTVAVWGRGRWDDSAAHGAADLKIGSGGWHQGTPCTAFKTVCQSGERTDRDGRAYCASQTDRPRQTLCFRGAVQGQAGADFSTNACHRYQGDGGLHDVQYIIVGPKAPSGETTDCEGEPILLPEDFVGCCYEGSDGRRAWTYDVTKAQCDARLKSWATPNNTIAPHARCDDFFLPPRPKSSWLHHLFGPGAFTGGATPPG